VLAGLAILAVLAVIGAIALPSLLGGGGDPSQGNRSNEQAAVGGGSNGDGGGEQNRGGGGGDSAGDAQQTATPTSGAEETREPSGGGSGQGGQQDGQQEQEASPEQAAEETVNDFYQTAADGEYERSSQLLTAGYREDTWPSRATFEGTFDTLQSVQFTSGPEAQVDGDTATVSFSTIARHTNRVDRPDGTATLVRQGDEWKIDSLSVG